MITANNFFVHWLKEVDVKRYGHNIPILPLNNILELCRYPDTILKHMPDKSLETFQSDLLYSNKKVVLTGGRDRKLNNDNDQDNRSDNNLDNRIAKFHDLIGTNNVYRIPLRFLVDLGFVNFPMKFDTKFVFTLKQKSKLFQLRKKVTAVPNDPDAQIIFNAAPFMQYQQLKLTDNLKKHLEVSLLSKQALRKGIKLSPYQKSYEINRGIQYT